MLHLEGSDYGKAKRTYIEAIIEDCKQLFNAKISNHFFRDNNLKVAFCTTENQAVVYEVFCEQFFPLYLADNYSRTNYFAAQAMTKVPDGIYGILICLDTFDEGDDWYQIILHEMSHIFCIIHEIGGENFQYKYSKEYLGETEQYWYSSIGYAVWSEFIANYIASQINPLVMPLSLAKLRVVIRGLDEGMNVNNPDRAQNCSQVLSYIFLNSRIRAAKDADSVFQILEKNRIFASKERSGHYHEIISLLFDRLEQERYWTIGPEFIEKLGTAYLSLLNW